MSKHDHPEPKPACTHMADEGRGAAVPTLRFCGKCDAVECTACGKEWKAKGEAFDIYRQFANQKRWPPNERIGDPYGPRSFLQADPIALGSPVGRVTFSHEHCDR